MILRIVPMVSVVTSLALAWTLTGCNSIATTNLALTTTTERVSQTNFTLGELRSAVVGESVVRVKGYVLKKTSLPAFRASQSGSTHLNSIFGPGPSTTINADLEYPMIGERVVDGKHVWLAQIAPDSYVQIYDDGSPRNRLMMITVTGVWVELNTDAIFEPASMRFSRVIKIDENAIAAGENYEIVFTGRDEGSLRFQYREYTSEDMARPAYSQDLTYPVSSKSIRFRGLTIEVTSVGNDDITYRVVSRTPRNLS